VRVSESNGLDALAIAVVGGLSSGRPFDRARLACQAGSGRTSLVDVALALRPFKTRGAVTADVEAAVQRTVSGLLGQLPASDFTVSVRCEQESLARLLHSAAFTGYLLRGVETRHSLVASLQDDDSSVEDGERTATGPPPAESVLAQLPPEVRSYMSSLESQLVAAHTQLALVKQAEAQREQEESTSSGGNALLALLKSMHAHQVDALAKGTPDARAAVQALIHSLLGKLPASRSRNRSAVYGGTLLDGIGGLHGPSELAQSVESSREYIHELLSWTMWAGYHLKCTEERLALSAIMESDAPPETRDDQSHNASFGGEEWRPFLR
jgi:Protein of unknown function (DUF760)